MSSTSPRAPADGRRTAPPTEPNEYCRRADAHGCRNQPAMCSRDFMITAGARTSRATKSGTAEWARDPNGDSRRLVTRVPSAQERRRREQLVQIVINRRGPAAGCRKSTKRALWLPARLRASSPRRSRRLPGRVQSSDLARALCPLADDARARPPARHGRSQSQTNAGVRRLAGRTPRTRPLRASCEPTLGRLLSRGSDTTPVSNDAGRRLRRDAVPATPAVT
jgi:hypothetical protein